MNFHGWEHTWNNLSKQYVKWKFKMLELMVHREKAKEEVCVIDDIYISQWERRRDHSCYRRLLVMLRIVKKKTTEEWILRPRSHCKLLNRGNLICMSNKNISLKCEPIVWKCSISFQNEQHSQTWNFLRYNQERHLFKLWFTEGYQRTISEHSSCLQNSFLFIGSFGFK